MSAGGGTLPAWGARWHRSCPGRPLARLIGGGILIVAGMAIVLAATTDLRGVMNVMLAVIVTVAGLALLVGPWVWNLGQELITERTSRVRSEARAEMAAHLHDSVLQTLAMIQRAREPREMAMLARTQERDLRAWLYGRAPSVPGVRLRDALDAMAGRIERSHAVGWRPWSSATPPWTKPCAPWWRPPARPL